MEDEVEQVLCRSLLPCDLEVALLQPLEVVDAIVGQEVQTELNAFDFFHDEFDDLKRISLLVDLFDDVGFFDEDRVNELDKLMLESEALLAQLAVEHPCVVDVELLARHVIARLFLHCCVRLGLLLLELRARGLI